MSILGDNSGASSVVQPLTHARSIQAIPGLILALLAAWQVVLAIPSLFPDMASIGAFDESHHLASGYRFWHDHEIPVLMGRPLVFAFLGVVYGFAQHADNWLVCASTISRVSLFCSLWAITFCFARSISRHVPQTLFLALVCASPIAVKLAGNPTDGLYALMVSLFALLCVRVSERPTIVTSLGLGLSAAFAGFARPEGFVLAPIAAVVVFFKNGSRQRWQSLIVLGLAVGICIAGAIVARKVVFGQAGTISVTYLQYAGLEMGHKSMLESAFHGYQGTGNPWREAQVLARKFYGTGPENRLSVMKAIARAPGFYLTGVMHRLKVLPRMAFEDYGGISGAFVCILMVFGYVRLCRQPELRYLWPLLLIFLNVMPAILLVIRESFLLFDFVIAIFAAAIAVVFLEAVQPARKNLLAGAWIALLIAVALSVLPLKYSTSVGMSLLSMFLLSRVVVAAHSVHAKKVRALAGAGLIVVGVSLFCISGDTVSKSLDSARAVFARGAVVNADPESRVARFLQSSFSPGTSIASYAAKVPVTARLKLVELSGRIADLTTHEKIRAWLKGNHISVVYLDRYLKEFEPEIWQRISHSRESLLKVVYEDGDYIVLVPAESSSPR